MTVPSPSETARAAALIRGIDDATRRIDVLGRLIEAADAAVVANNHARSDRLAFGADPDRLAALIALARRTDPYTRERIPAAYRWFLVSLLDASRSSLTRHTIDYDALTPAARPYLLAPYLRLTVGDAYPMLDLQRSDPSGGILVYVHTGGRADPQAWQSQLPAISDWLGANWQLTASTATTITLTRREALPEVVPMSPSYRQPGALFTGIELVSHRPTYTPFSHLTSGTFIVGASGMGKSNATHLIVQDLLANLHLFQALFLVDGKEGMTFARYGRHAPHKVRLLTDEPDLWALTTRLVEVVRKRNAALRTAGLDNAPGHYIGVVIEEMSTYTAKPSSDSRSEANKAHARFLDELAMLARRGRSAGLRLIITAQEPTDNQIPTTVRNNCLTTIAFQLPVDAHAVAVFGQLEGLPADPRKLPRGRALVRHGMTGVTQAVQFPLAPVQRK